MRGLRRLRRCLRCGICRSAGNRDQGSGNRSAGSRESGRRGQKARDQRSERSGVDTVSGHGDAAGDERVLAGGGAALAGEDGRNGAGDGGGAEARAARSEASDAISQSGDCRVVPGSAVSAQLVRGDLEISATCTVTYVDPKQLLACGHPIMQAGPVSMPMTKAEVVATLASPLNAFKIINTERDHRGVYGGSGRRRSGACSGPSRR